MGLLDLNLDVIEVTLSHARPIDALQLALTCRTAHALAMPRFLSEVVLGSNERKRIQKQVDKFCRFMLADVSSRLPHLKSLTLGKYAFENREGLGIRYHYSCAAKLAEVVRLAPRLRRISIYDSESLFEAAPRLASALALTPNLEFIHFTDVDVQSLTVLSHMKSHPRSVDLEMSHWRDDEGVTHYGSFGDNKDLFLANFTTSLVSVKLKWCSNIIKQLQSDTVWIGVRYLSLSGAAVTSLSFLARAFPNLNTLHVESRRVDGGAIATTKWSSLDCVSTHCPLPLSCRVRRLELVYDLDTISPDLQHWRSATMSMLRNTHPVILACCPDAEMLRVIADSVRSLRFIQIFLHDPVTPETGREKDLEVWINALIPILNAVPLIGLSFMLAPRDLIDDSHMARYAAIISAFISTVEYVGFDRLNPSISDGSLDELEQCLWYRVASKSGDAANLGRLSESESILARHRLSNTLRG